MQVVKVFWHVAAAARTPGPSMEKKAEIQKGDTCIINITNKMIIDCGHGTIDLDRKDTSIDNNVVCLSVTS